MIYPNLYKKYSISQAEIIGFNQTTYFASGKRDNSYYMKLQKLSSIGQLKN